MNARKTHCPHGHEYNERNTGTQELATLLDKFGVAFDASANSALQVLKSNGSTARKATLLAALRYRKRDGYQTTGTASGTAPLRTSQNENGNQQEPYWEPAPEPAGTASRAQREPGSPYKGEPVPGRR